MDIPNKKELFETGERIAQVHLKSKGYQMLSHNYRRQTGEIDIIARTGNTLVFVEVKTRSYHSISSALGNVSYPKQKKISKTALLYINSNPDLSNLQTRFDIIVVFFNAKDNDYSVKHFIDAFLPVLDY